MSDTTHLTGGVFHWVLQTTWQAAILAGLILVVRWALRGRLSPSWRYGLWLLLVVRLLMPAIPRSAFSIFNFSLPQSIHSASTIGTRGMASIARPLPAAQSAGKVNWFDIATYGWLAGVCFFGARLVWTNARFRARLDGWSVVTDESANQLLNECRSAFRVSQPVRLVECDEVEGPAVYGFWRKWLLLPDGAFERFSREELRCVFLHELAHIKRGDLAVNWLIAMLQALHWFNPVLWLAWARMRADRELATDALALAYVNQKDRVSYGETILKALEGLIGGRVSWELLGIVENKAQLKERLVAIARPGKTWKLAAAAVAVFLALVGLTGALNDLNSGTYRELPPSSANSIIDPDRLPGRHPDFTPFLQRELDELDMKIRDVNEELANLKGNTNAALLVFELQSEREQIVSASNFYAQKLEEERAKWRQ